MSRIYLSPPEMAARERELLLDAFDSNWITPLGPHVNAFEEEFAAFVDAPAAAALSSGTAALHLALMLAGVEPDDEVIVSDLTFSAPANAVHYVGATPRFVDAERETWNIDPDLLDVELADRGERVTAVIAVDIYGQCAQLDRIAEICERHGVALIEDAAEALGATWRDRPAGSWGRYGAFSFNGNKIITTGGGGMLVGQADEMERARYLASQARQPFAHYEHTEIGFNYRLSNLLASVGRGQLEDLPRKIARRHEINSMYRSALADIEAVSFMPWDSRGRTNGWLTVIQLDPSLAPTSPAAVCAAMDAADIEARPAWKPMHLQPVFGNASCRGGEVSAELFERGVCLPSGSQMTNVDVVRVVSVLRTLLSPK